jgi:hypothetical protein
LGANGSSSVVAHSLPPPQAALKSSTGSSMRENGPAGGGGGAMTGGGAITVLARVLDFMCWREEAGGAGRSILGGGTEFGRVLGAEDVSAAPVSVCIWPLTEVSLLVKDDIAHPVHDEASGCGVPVRETLSAGLVPGACGSRVSGRLRACLRTR